MTLIRLEIRKRRKSMVSWSVVIAVLTLLFMSFYPQMQTEELAALTQMKLQGFSKGFLTAFGLETMPDFAQIEEYFLYVFQYIFFAACLLAVILGVDLLQSEEADGTIEYLYAMPLSRKQIYGYKMLAAMILYTIFFVWMWAVSFGTIYFLKPENIQISVLFNKEMYGTILYTYLAALAYMALGIMLSALLRTSAKSASVGLGVFLITYLLGIIGNAVEKASPLRYGSFYDYANPSHLFYHGIEPVKGWILAGVAVGFVLAGLFIYQKKEFL